MVERNEIRLRIIEAVLPTATRNGFSDPSKIVEICTQLESYVVLSEPDKVGNSSDPQTSRKTGRSRKEATGTEAKGDSVDPTHGG